MDHLDWTWMRSGAWVIALLAMGCGGGKSGGPSSGGRSGVSSGGAGAATGGTVGSGGSAAGGSAGRPAGGTGAEGGSAGPVHTGGSGALGGSGGSGALGGRGGSGALGGNDARGGSGGAGSLLAPYAKSGRRLKAMGFVTDGAQQFQYVEDSDFGQPCEFVESADGQRLLCVPKVQASRIFLDARCTEPATLVEDRQRAANIVSVDATRSSNPCPGKFPPYRSTYKVGALVPDPATPAPRYQLLQDGTCTMTLGWSGSPTYRLSPVADTELVGARRQVVPLGTELSMTRIVADDGAELTYGVVTADGTPCAIQGNGACVPEPVAVGVSGIYVDASCTRPSLDFNDGQCGVPHYTVKTQADGVHIFQVVKSAQAYVRAFNPMTNASTCDPLLNTLTHFDAGAEVTSPFARVERVVTVGGGPLRLEVFVWPDPNAAPAALIPVATRQKPGEFLLAGGSTCQVRDASDGTRRCASVDRMIWYNDGFVDAACKQPLFLSTKSQRAEPAAASPRAAATDAMSRLTAIYTVQPFPGQQQYHLSAANDCTPGSLTTVPGETLEYWAPVDRTEITTLPTVELQPL